MRFILLTLIFLLSWPCLSTEAFDGLISWRGSQQDHLLLLSPGRGSYPESPYQSGMTSDQYLHEVVSRLDPHVRQYIKAGGLVGHIDQVFKLPLEGLPREFAAEVLRLVFNGTWNSPTGVSYDFRLIAVYFPLEPQVGLSGRTILEAYKKFVKGGAFILEAPGTEIARGMICRSFL